MSNRGFQFVRVIWQTLCLLLLLAPPAAAQTTKTNAPLKPAFYRMNELEAARKRAAAEDKPIAWISSEDRHLAPVKNLLNGGSHAATLYAVRALQAETVIVFSTASTQNHQEPAIVDEALHTPDPHYTIPGVIILTPAMDRVITKVFYIDDSKERIRAFTEVLKKIRDKDSWNRKQEKNQ